MSTSKAPFRFDYVGSFLRPSELIDARYEFDEGKISHEQLKQVEDKAIEDLIKKQKQAGYSVITDGEFRRKSWHLDFMWGLNGIERVELDHGYFFQGIETYHCSVQIKDKINGDNHPFVEHFKYVKQFEDEGVVAKQTLPAPAQLITELFRSDNVESTLAVYPDYEELIRDIAKAYQTVFAQLYAAGCRNIQLDDCTWGMVVDKNYLVKKYGKLVSVKEEAEKYLKINNLALENKPEDLTITTHVCRGNYQSRYAASGPYNEIAPVLFARENVDAFYLEYDDERSGGFEPLKYVADGKKIVLGLITSKNPTLEDKEKVIERIHEAAKYVPLQNLCLSPQCGFSSNETGNELTEEDQWKKLALVKEIAEFVWGK
ncbi:MAG: 5-methyltetrahydropteroyltriglutamate--homocysteine S-methyltransferase [Pseudobutyrivibrio sp.]|nr:5-methyltetrahydropteroyltriglutamate--homocysteine S-methyltransferase [Pseudobutyrivibrio sp.]